MAWIRKSDIEFLKSKCEQREDQKWWTKDGQAVMQFVTGRSIWIDGFMGGSGEVRQIIHLYVGQPPEITYGTPINESEVVEIG